jgi:DNA-binding beta-propeller fold protein YncE
MEPRLQFLTFISSENDVGKQQSAFKEFLLGEIPSEKRIERPYDIAAVKGKIYITDRTHKAIIIIDLEKREFSYLETRRGGALSEPAGLWITNDGFKYITDFKRKQVVVFDNEDNYVRAYGSKDVLDKPLDVAVYENKVYVCDFNKHKIFVFDRENGEVIQTIGEEGAEEGKLFKPSAVVVDNEGNVLVNDSFNFRIQRFSPEGELINVVGYHGDTVGGFARPKGIGIDNVNHLYVVDAAFENVQIFDASKGTPLLFFGGFGQGGLNPGSMYLPLGISIDYENIEFFSKYADKDFKLKYIVYVGNMVGRHRLNVYGFGKWIGEKLPDVE